MNQVSFVFFIQSIVLCVLLYNYLHSMGSKSLNECKKVGVKFCYLFLLTERLKRSVSYFAKIPPLDKMLNII